MSDLFKNLKLPASVSAASVLVTSLVCHFNDKGYEEELIALGECLSSVTNHNANVSQLNADYAQAVLTIQGDSYTIGINRSENNESGSDDLSVNQKRTEALEPIYRVTRQCVDATGLNSKIAIIPHVK